jgi:hypothetical protein
MTLDLNVISSMKFLESYQLDNRCWWLRPIMLATWEAQNRRIKVLSQPRQKVHEILSQKQNKTKNPSQKNKAGGVAQDEGPEFKPQYHQKRKKKSISKQGVFVYTL